MNSILVETVTIDNGDTMNSIYVETVTSDYGETVTSDYGESENIRMPHKLSFFRDISSCRFSFEGNIKR